MAENESFFRKVVRFVANPATDWTELNSRQEGDTRELEIEKSELKAMIERKRRNDFVRKREFDMLRRVRREGLSPEQLAALGGSSRLDDSEARLPEGRGPRPDSGVKAKIDEIEQQMVGDGFVSTRKATGLNTSPARLRREPGQGPPPGRSLPSLHETLPAHSTGETRPEDSGLLPALPPLADADRPAATAPVQMASGLPPLASTSPVSFELPGDGFDGVPVPATARPAKTTATPVSAPVLNADPRGFGTPFSVEISEVVHDPELDEAVIAFANADFSQCEDSLRHLTGGSGVRAQHADTWLVLFDLYRATGQQQRFESLALDYAQQFGWSAPQWYSMPQMVAEATAEEPLVPRHGSSGLPAPSAADVGWSCPELLDIDAVARLRSQTLQLPLPWVLDWSGLRSVEPEAAMQLSTLMRGWSTQALEMRWMAGDRLLTALQEAAPTGMRDADPVFWLTRLEALRLANRADQFDETAIDYCVTYEVSPPSWEPARCKLSITDEGQSTRGPWSLVSALSTSFMESSLVEDAAGQEIAQVELTGQLMGDISHTLDRIHENLGTAPIINVSCTRLIRVDFIAAGDLLNWVLTRRSENRAVHFADAHRLVALFFGAMGINEHAKVQVRKV